jgi:alanyl-tRNA synthetase
VTGDNALAWVQAQEATIAAAAAALKAPASEIEAKIAQLIEGAKATERELAKLKAKLASSAGDDLAGSAVDVNGAKVLAVALDGADLKTLRETMDKLKDKLGTAAIVLSAVADGKVTLIAGVTANLTSKIKAGELVNHVAQQVGGKGGGDPTWRKPGHESSRVAGGAHVGEGVGRRAAALKAVASPRINRRTRKVYGTASWRYARTDERARRRPIARSLRVPRDGG